MAETRKLLQQERWALLPEDILYRRVNSVVSPISHAHQHWHHDLSFSTGDTLSYTEHVCLSHFCSCQHGTPQFPFMGLKDSLLDTFFFFTLIHKSNGDNLTIEQITSKQWPNSSHGENLQCLKLVPSCFLLQELHGQQLTETHGEMQQNGFVATPDWHSPFRLTVQTDLH